MATKQEILKKHFRAEFGHDGHGKFMSYILDAMEEYVQQEKENNFWNDDKVIDFVNWYIKVCNLDFKYIIENGSIVESFKNGDNPDDWNIKLSAT